MQNLADWERRETRIKIIEEGGVKVTSVGYMLAGNDEAVCFFIDCADRAYVYSSTRSDNHCPVIHLSDDNPESEFTTVEFPDFPGWNFHSAGGGRKTIAIALSKWPDLDQFRVGGNGQLPRPEGRSL